MKYIMLEGKTTGYFHPVVFDDALIHVSMAPKASSPYRIRSAGFVKVDKYLVSTYGESDSLRGMKPHPDDARILAFFLQQGVSGLALANMLLAHTIAKIGRD